MISLKGIRLFVNQPLDVGTQVTTSANQANYLIKVMRQKISDKAIIFNGRDGEFLSEIIEIGKKQVDLEVEKQLRPQEEEPDIWLIFAPIKLGKIDFLAAKATELGVSALIPVFTERTIVNRVNKNRLEANAIEAAELSERLTVPEIHEPQKLIKLMSSFPKDRNIILCDESGSAKPIGKVLGELKKQNHKKYAILIGPEGGFTQKEFKFLYRQKNVYPASLGSRIMRADTAALAALAIWQNYLGDMNHEC